MHESAEAATEFAISLLQTLVIEESKVISELHNLVDALAKVYFCLFYGGECIPWYLYVKLLTNFNFQLSAKPGSPESLQQLVEIVKNPAAGVVPLSGVNVGKEDKVRQLKDKKVTGYFIVCS